MCRPYFSNLSIEVMPLSTEDYERLTHSGLNGVVCFQETYNHKRYKLYHPAGMKSKFEWRCDGFDRMGMAGVHKIGMGVLIGLEDWRTDVTMMARHLTYLRKRYWKTKYSVNFPRMRPSESGFQPNVVMSDRGTRATHLRIPHLRPRCGHLLLHTRGTRLPQQYGHSGSHHHERRIED